MPTIELCRTTSSRPTRGGPADDDPGAVAVWCAARIEKRTFSIFIDYASQGPRLAPTELWGWIRRTFVTFPRSRVRLQLSAGVPKVLLFGAFRVQRRLPHRLDIRVARDFRPSSVQNAGQIWRRLLPPLAWRVRSTV